MFPLFLRRIVRLGLVWLGTALPPATAVFAQESKQEHILFQAIRRGDTELLRGALRAGTPPDVRASDGTTPLMAAALHGSAEMVSALLDAGADPRAASEAGVTALLWGAWDANKVRLLLDRGADPNARSALGNTPLMARCHYIPNNRKAMRWQVPSHPERSFRKYDLISMNPAEHQRRPLIRRIAYV
jgi:hypothetical protein